MIQKFKNFANDENGAITVDWVVLTAVILGVMFGALNTFSQGTVAHAELTSQTMDATGIPTY